MKNKHLSLDDRFNIENGLVNNLSFKEIGKTIDRNCTTISMKIRNHYITKNTGAIGKPFQDCIHRYNCSFRVKSTRCNQNNCPHCEKQICSKLNKPPYVCNDCENKNKCSLTKV